MTKFTANVIQDPDDENELAIEFPEGVMEDLDWRPGDLIEWKLLDNGDVLATNKTLKERQENKEK